MKMNLEEIQKRFACATEKVFERWGKLQHFVVFRGTRKHCTGNEAHRRFGKSDVL